MTIATGGVVLAINFRLPARKSGGVYADALRLQPNR